MTQEWRFYCGQMRQKLYYADMANNNIHILDSGSKYFAAICEEKDGTTIITHMAGLSAGSDCFSKLNKILMGSRDIHLGHYHNAINKAASVIRTYGKESGEMIDYYTILAVFDHSGISVNNMSDFLTAMTFDI